MTKLVIALTCAFIAGGLMVIALACYVAHADANAFVSGDLMVIFLAVTVGAVVLHLGDFRGERG